MPSSPRDRENPPPEVVAAQKARAMASPDLMAEFVTKGKFLRPKHIRLLGEKIAAAVMRGNGRIVVTMPPRHGKSQLCSWWTPTWFLSLFPGKRVMLGSYEADFAATWGRKVRDQMNELKWLTKDIEVRDDSAAASRWEIKDHGGGMMTAGVGGPMSGKGADLMIIDDPIKNEAEASSPVARENLMNWWRSVAYTRLEPGGTVIIIHTRWNEDDMIGQILKEDSHDHQWEVLNFPAIAEDFDVLGRKPGEALWPERYDEKRLERMKKDVGSYTWSALYQQRPVPAEGGVFKREWFPKERRYRRMQDGSIQLGSLNVPRHLMHVFTTCDLAASVKSWADFTVMSTWGVYWLGHQPLVFLLDVFKKRLEGPDIVAKLSEIIRTWDSDYARVEKVAFQLALVQDARRQGLPIREFVPDKDKISRALAATPYCEAGQIILPEWAPWLSDAESEMYAFPNAAHDDFVDTLSMMIQEIRGRTGGIPGDIDVVEALAKKAGIQSCVAEPGADPINFLAEKMLDPMNWGEFDYYKF